MDSNEGVTVMIFCVMSYIIPNVNQTCWKDGLDMSENLTGDGH